MADVDPALGQEILDVAQRQRVLHVHQHRQTDYLGRAVEIAERVSDGLKLPQPKTTRKIGLTMPSAAPTPQIVYSKEDPSPQRAAQESLVRAEPPATPDAKLSPEVKPAAEAKPPPEAIVERSVRMRVAAAE